MKVYYQRALISINNAKDEDLWLLDNGHGGMIDGEYQTAGKRSPVFDGQQIYEGVWNREIVKLLARLMDRAGKNYAIIVPEEKDVPLLERVDRCEKIQSHYTTFKCMGISVHGNGYNKESANGIEVWTSIGETYSDYIAECFMDNAKRLGFAMRYGNGDEDKEARFTIITKTSMPFILTENGFYTNKEDFKKMNDPKFKKEIAKVHFKTINDA